MDSQRIRETFLRFFQEHDHRVMPSAPLVPPGDPTLLFTSAGMVQFKPYFEGRAEPPARRLTSVQKCFRTSDIDSVGDTSHLTFFEMLGNFSIGDYFKAEAIPWAWELVTAKNWFAMAPDRLWAAVYLDDDEAFDLWRKVAVPAERIMRYGEEHNYWFSGDVGPCGPCSELHYDFGPTPGCPECQRDACHPAVECGRFLEIWNLVFMTYFQHPDGSRTPLPAKNIDTGAGLERMAVVLQDVRSVYETDLFAPIIRRIEELCGRRYGEDAATNRAMRIVAEHTRAAAFLIGDDKTPVLPSNEERGYAVRRVLRRAIYYGRHYLGLDRPFMAEVANAVVETMGQAYPELRQQSEFVLRIIQPEEERFEETLSRGEDLLDEVLDGTRRSVELQLPAVQEQLDTVRRALEEYYPFLEEQMETLTDAMQPLRDALARQDEALRHAMQDILARQDEALRDAMQPLRDALARQDEALRDAMQPLQDALARQDEALRDAMQDALARQDEALRDAVRPLQDALATLGVIDAAQAFKLHDTYGFPKELTAEIARDTGLDIDEEGFEREMEKQRERARAAAKFGAEASTDAYGTLAEMQTEFLGYETLTTETTVVALLVHDAQADSAAEGEAVEVVLRETPFYGEAGGQVGDRGEIIGPHGRVRVDDTQRAAERLIVHRGRVVEGRIAVNDAVVAQVDEARRHDIMRNHTATHLLHAALRRVLGTHVRQAGSLVTPDRLRFDFTHVEALKPEELAAVQSLVNDRIRADLPVRTRQSSFDDAMAEGVLAFFDEKYGDQVRVVETKEDGERFSAELCGGTHCSSTGQIGLCLVVGESSVGAGMRRIEALTGRGAEAYVAERLAALQGVSQRLGVAPSDLEPKLSSLLDDLEAARKQVQALERAVAAPAAAGLAKRAQSVDGVAVLAARVEAPSQDTLRHMGDVLRQRLGSAVIVLGATLGGRPMFMAMVTPDLVKRGLHAGHILKRVASAAGGGGGGRPEMAQGGGTDPAKLDEALSLVEPTVRELLAKKG
jgi:alanyl-tRNA synthetase